MSTISIRLPDSLHSMAKAMASQDHMSMNQFIASAVAEKVSALATETYLKDRAERGNHDNFMAALAAVPAQPPAAQDEI